MNELTYYSDLIKPLWAPPAWLFGPVWTILYILIVISFGFVFYQAITKKIPSRIALPFVLNLFFNAMFTPIQFVLKNNLLACVDILLVVGTLIWAFYAIWPRARWVVYINIPYLLWGTFATILQITITYLNR